MRENLMLRGIIMNKHLLAIVCVSACACLLVASCDNGETPVFPAASSYCHYMPLTVGNKWVYEVTTQTKYEPAAVNDYTFEVTATKRNYKGYTSAYIISITKDGNPAGELTAVNDNDAVYLDRAIWSYVMGEDMAVGGWTQTGFVNEEPLQYLRSETIAVPAGEFGDCRSLLADNNNEFTPESWKECYAKGVGLVYYINNHKEYESTVPYNLIDWRTVEYQLKSYVVKAASN
jgi:hypothetical protein